MVKSAISNFVIIISLIIIFFGYALNSLQFTIILLGMLCIIGIFVQNVVRINLSQILFFSFVLIATISLFYTSDERQSIPYVISLWALFFIQFFMDNNIKNSGNLKKGIFLFSGIHVLMTILNAVIPEVVSLISRNIIHGDDFVYNQLVLLNGSNAGITNETGTNALFVSIFVGFSFIYATLNKHRLKFILFTLVGIVALLMTNKRGILLAAIIGITCILFMINLYKKNIKFNFYILSVSFLLILIILNSSYFNDFLEYNLRKGGGDLSNGRIILWRETLSFAKDNFLLGNGIRTMYTELNSGTHNVYLQVLSETGIFGVLALISYFISNMVNTTKILVKQFNIINLCSLYFQIVFLVYCFTGNPIYNISFFLLYIVTSSLSENDNAMLGRENSNAEMGNNTVTTDNLKI